MLQLTILIASIAVSVVAVCPICRDENGYRRPVDIACGHIYCTPCIYEFWSRKYVKKCPMCYKVTRKAEIRRCYMEKEQEYDGDLSFNTSKYLLQFKLTIEVIISFTDTGGSPVRLVSPLLSLVSVA